MIFMSVGNDNSADFLSVFHDIGKIRDDKVNAEHILLREHQPSIHDDHIVRKFKYRRVEADLLNATKGNYRKGVFQLCHQILK